MSIAKKISLAFRAKAEKALDRLEDPRESLDYSYREHVDLLTKVRRDVAATSASRARMDARMKALHREQAELDDQAGLAPEADPEPGQRQVPRSRDQIQEELSRLVAEYDLALAEQERLMAIRDRLQTKVDTFRARKESIEATYAAAEAQNKRRRIRSDLAAEVDSVELDTAPCRRQCELLTQLRSSIDDITNFFEDLEREIGILRQWHAELEEQSGGKPSAEEGDLVEFAFVLRALTGRIISHLSAQRDSFKSEEENLEEAYRRLKARISG